MAQPYKSLPTAHQANSTPKIALSTAKNFDVKKVKAHIVCYADKDGNLIGNYDNAELNTRAKTLITHANFKGILGTSVSDYSDTPFTIIGVGAPDKIASGIKKIAEATYNTIKNHKKAVVIWGDTLCQKHLGQFALALLNASYSFDKYLSKPTDKVPLSAITFINTQADNDYKTAIAHVTATYNGMVLARDLGNEAPNVCSPSYFAKVAKQLSKDHADLVSLNILGEKEMAKLGMGCFLSVSQGSNEEGKLIVLEYRGKSTKGKKAKLKDPIALVGKGITFDTGGISLKPAAGMEEMKFDMGGAAAMIGTLKGVCEARLPIDMVVVLACAENMPSGGASRPGDIITAMNGTSVEVLNTDAEGRLVLSDALCYTQDTYSPKVIIDAATLTGACIIALGHVRSAVYTNDEDTLFALQSASDYSGDLIWQMPLDDEYKEQIKSPVADIQNTGGRAAGSVTAALFLAHFIKDGQAWAHLDIAGTAWKDGKRNALGRPVPLLMQYLANLS